MIEIEFFKDIKDQKAKLIGPFTTRQALCAVVGLAGGLGTFFYLKNLLGGVSFLCYFPAMVVAVPAVLIGWVEPYGLPFEKYAKIVLETYLLSPKKKIYKTKNLYEEFEKELALEEKMEQEKSALALKETEKNSKNKNKSKVTNSENKSGKKGDK